MAKKKKSSTSTQGRLYQYSSERDFEHSYSGDKPNTHIREFVETFGTPFDPESDDKVLMKAFDSSVDVEKRKTPITDLHLYWSKKHPDAIKQYMKHYTMPGDVVLDTFSGSGMTAMVALGLGRHAIAIDLSPAATFITKNYCAAVDGDEVKKECQRVLDAVESKYRWLYETKCDRCNGAADIAYTVYSFTTKCLKCMFEFPFFAANENRCPKCNDPLSKRPESLNYVPVETSYICRGKCKPKRDSRSLFSDEKKKAKYFKNLDVKLIERIEGQEIPFDYPNPEMPAETRSHVLRSKGITHFKDIYTHRNFWATCAILKEIRTNTPEHLQDSLLFVMGTVFFPTSKQCCHDYPSTMKGTYYVPPIGRELSVFFNFKGRINRKSGGINAVTNLVDAKAELLISTQSACNLTLIPANSIDYVFTDPPYGDKIPFWELNLIWEYWWGFDTNWEKDEIIINPRRGKKEKEWNRKMKATFEELYRVLKPGRWLSLCYHDTSEMTWAAIQDLAAEVGFHPDTAESAVYIDIKQKTFKQLREKHGERVAKRDLVINFRKPLLSEVGDSAIVFTGKEDPRTFREKAGAVIKKYLLEHPGSPRDQIYDFLVSNLVRTGEMERHNFDELLALFADQAGDDANRWYLKADVQEEYDASAAAEEESAATRLLPIVDAFLKEYPEHEGIRYSDLFEAYLYVVPTKEKPQRELKEFILDFFIRTPDGAYRSPQDEAESAVLAEVRKSGASRRIRRFLRFLEAGMAIPTNERPNDATLADWIRRCKRAGMYAEGKLMFENSGLDLDSLSDEAMVNAEEDYQICVRELNKAKGKEHAKKSTKNTNKTKKSK